MSAFTRVTDQRIDLCLNIRPSDSTTPICSHITTPVKKNEQTFRLHGRSLSNRLSIDLRLKFSLPAVFLRRRKCTSLSVLVLVVVSDGHKFSKERDRTALLLKHEHEHLFVVVVVVTEDCENCDDGGGSTARKCTLSR